MKYAIISVMLNLIFLSTSVLSSDELCISKKCYLERYEKLQGPDEIYSWTSKFLSEYVYDLDEETFRLALEKMDMLAIQGNKSAILFLHEFYLIGPIEKSNQLSLKYLKLYPNIESEPDLLFSLGILYKRVDPVLYNEKSIALIEKALSLGSLSAIEHIAKKQVRSKSRHEIVEGGKKLKMLSENGKLSSMHYYSLFLIREYINNNCDLDIKKEAIYWHNKAKSKDLNKRFEDTRYNFLDKADNFCFSEASK